MKIQTKWLLGVLAAVVFLGNGEVRGQVGPVNVKVEVEDAPNSRGSTDARMLEITLNNTKSVGLTNLVVEYWILSRDVENKEIAIAKEGNQTVTLGPVARETVKSIPGRFYHTKPKVEGKGKSAKTTKATGTKFYGFGVRVSLEGKVVLEQYEPRELKKTIEDLKTTPAEPDAAADKAAKKEAKKTKKK